MSSTTTSSIMVRDVRPCKKYQPNVCRNTTTTWPPLMLGRTSHSTYPKIRCATNPSTETESQVRCWEVSDLRSSTRIQISSRTHMTMTTYVPTRRSRNSNRYAENAKKNGGDGSYRQLQRYHDNKQAILRHSALLNAFKHNRLPNRSTMIKHNITESDVAGFMTEMRNPWFFDFYTDSWKLQFPNDRFQC